MNIHRGLSICWRLWVVLALMVICLLPLLWLFVGAFKHRVDMLATSPSFFFQPTLDNFSQAFVRNEYYRFVLNSALVAVGSGTLSMILGVPAAYVFSRTKLTGRDHWLFFILSTRMAPVAALALPYFLLFREVNLLNSIVGLMLGHTTLNLAFVIWTMKAFFDDVPRAVDDAARMDGLRHTQILRLLLRTVAPGLAVVGVLCVVFSWNEFFLSMVLAGRRSQTLPVSILGLVTPAGTSWGQVAAIAVATVAPVFTLVVLAGRTLVRGLTFGVLKEG